MSNETPKGISIEVTVRRTMTLVPKDLENWTIAELEEFEDDGFAGDGQDIVLSDTRCDREDVDEFDIDEKRFAEYVEWRRKNGYTGRRRDGWPEAPHVV